MTAQAVVYAIVVLAAAMFGVESLDTPRGPITVDVPGQTYMMNQRWKRAPPIFEIGINVVVNFGRQEITLGIRDKILGQKALNYLKMGAVRDEPTRTGRLKLKQNRKMVQQFRKSGNQLTANTDFKNINPTGVLPFFNPEVHGFWGRVGNMKVILRTSSRSYPNQATIEMSDLTAKKNRAITYKFRYNNLVKRTQRKQ